MSRSLPDNDISSSLTDSPLLGRGPSFQFIAMVTTCHQSTLKGGVARRLVEEWNDSTDEHMYGIGITTGRLQKYLFPLSGMRLRDRKKQAMQTSGRTLRLHGVRVQGP